MDYIRYDDIIESSMRDVICKVFKKVAKEGLKGEHHFVISFLTNHFGVVLSDTIKKRFPSEMTIIIQHQFQSLVALDSCFKISLSFSGAMEHLTVPYSAITSFADPSVNFGLKFNSAEIPEIEDEIDFEQSIPEEDAKDSDIPAGKNIVSLDDFRKNRNK
ncbi:MAG: hypothetical protein K0R25_819 [Rickettsiaceae bacterium]|jgi:hypothetical protein|nr:hypothetical protein [Rickettsiaceae bacterium]